MPTEQEKSPGTTLGARAPYTGNDAYLVDIKEVPGVLGSIQVDATAPDGSVESAVFSGPRASDRAQKYIDSMDGYERRPPREYPKHIRRGGVDHLALDAEHERKLGPPTDADRAEEDAQKKAVVDTHGLHALSDEARARVAANIDPGPRPERLPEGESDDDYVARLAKWQDDRRGGPRVAGAPPAPEPYAPWGDYPGAMGDRQAEIDREDAERKANADKEAASMNALKGIDASKDTSKGKK